MLITVICMELYPTSLTRPTKFLITLSFSFLLYLLFLFYVLFIFYFLYLSFFMKTVLIFSSLICFLFRALLTALLVAKWGFTVLVYPSKKFSLLAWLLGSPMLHPCRWMSSWLVTDHFLITVSISHYHSWLVNDKIFQGWTIPQSL